MKIIENESDIVVDKELAVGLRIPTSIKTPVSYLKGLRQYKDIYNNIYEQMEVSGKLYKYNSIIGNAVDVLVDFAVTDIYPRPTGKKKLDKILEYFFKNVNDINSNALPGVKSLMQELALEWFTSGNAFPYEKWDNVDVEGKGVYILPSTINLLNPQAIHIPSGPIAFGQEVIYLKPNQDLMDKLKSDGRKDPEAALIKKAIPRSVLRSISTNTFGMDGIRLNPKYITHLKRKAKGYQAWGIPYLSRCFSCVSLLERLRELDESVAAGLVNLVTVYKVGTDEYPASPGRLQKFAALIRNPKATQTLVWAHDLEIEQVGPKDKVLQYSGKYKDAKEDLLIALGIPPELMSLKQGGDAWVSILSLIERLSNWRDTTKIWMERICDKISKYNGFSENVECAFSRMNLADEKAVKNLILAFYDRGLLSAQTALKESGHSYEIELSNKKSEQDQLELFVPPDLPFTGSNTEGRPQKNDPKNKDKTENTVDLKQQKKK